MRSFDTLYLFNTGSYDGEIVIWNPNSECATKKLQQRCKARLSRANTKMSMMSAQSDRPQTSESQGIYLHSCCCVLIGSLTHYIPCSPLAHKPLCVWVIRIGWQQPDTTPDEGGVNGGRCL